MLKATDIKS